MKPTTITLLFALFVCVGFQANASEFKQVTPASLSLQGGSESNIHWKAPTTSAYKVHVFVPKTGGIPNALYRIYPKGKRKGSIECLSSDIAFPCYEAVIDQTQHQNTWVQLMLNEDASTQWDFIKGKGYIVAVASNLEATEQLNLDIRVRFENRTVAIGKFYEGGMIFYVDGTGKHGLIAAPTDQTNPVDQSNKIKWYNDYGSGIHLTTGATATAVGTGADNTTLIARVQGAGVYAARICADLVLGGYDDWYLPSRDELKQMYQNIGNGSPAPFTNIGGFVDDLYWSSSEWDTYFAQLCNFGIRISNQCGYTAPKGYTFPVRAIRKF